MAVSFSPPPRCLASPAASAQKFDGQARSPRPRPIWRSVICPLYLSGQFAITGNPVLKDFALRRDDFDAAESARRDQVGRRQARRRRTRFWRSTRKSLPGDGDRSQPSSRRGTCFHKNMTFLGLDFKPDPANTGPRNGAKLETFKAPVDGQFLYVQLVDVTLAGTPIVTASNFRDG